MGIRKLMPENLPLTPATSARAAFLDLPAVLHSSRSTRYTKIFYQPSSDQACRSEERLDSLPNPYERIQLPLSFSQSPHSLIRVGGIQATKEFYS